MHVSELGWRPGKYSHDQLLAWRALHLTSEGERPGMNITHMSDQTESHNVMWFSKGKGNSLGEWSHFPATKPWQTASIFEMC